VVAAPAKPRDGEPIALVVTSTGEPRYRVVLDGTPYPDGRRRQVRSTLCRSKTLIGVAGDPSARMIRWCSG
jgi:hypothetical protein